MSEHDSELPDPMELFERMSRRAEEAEDAVDSPGLPDPTELYRELEQQHREQLPNPAELFQRMQQASPATETTEDSLPFLPDPDEPPLLEDSWPVAVDPHSVEEEFQTPDGHLPYFPAPDEPGISEPPLPYIPGPEEPGRAVELPKSDETLTDGFLKKLKDRFRKSRVDVSSESEPSLASPISSESSSPLPTPEELFRRMKAEREEAALNFESERGATLPETKLPTPEELFLRMEQEYAEQTGSQLPELPDLDALKAELEAEERALLDPDVEADLAGPERFVETVSDNIFSRAQPDLFTPPEIELWNEPEPEPEPEPETAKRRLPIPEKPPVPPPPSPIASPAPTASVRPETEPEPEGPSPTGTVRVDPDELRDPPLKRPKRRRAASYARQVAEEAEGAGGKKTFNRFSRQKLSIFTRQMAVMLKSGIQLHMAIQFAAESDPDLHEVLTAVMHKVESGYTFSAALGATSRTFDTIYVGLIQSGEMSGRLHEILGRLADALEREVEMRKRLVAVVTYPSVLLLVCMLGTLGFMFFILPTLVPLFEELDVDLPLPTKILLGSREAILPALALSAVLLVLYSFSHDRIADAIKKRPILERRFAQIPFHIPVIGKVYDKIVTARVLYSLSTMLDVGITLNQALARTEATAGNALVSLRLGKARMDLADGVGVTDCFRMNQLFSPSALYLISAGEESARLAEMFAFVAKIFDEDVEYALQTASSVLEPLIMVVMGVIVGFITIAAALPTIQLLQNFT